MTTQNAVISTITINHCHTGFLGYSKTGELIATISKMDNTGKFRIFWGGGVIYTNLSIGQGSVDLRNSANF